MTRTTRFLAGAAALAFVLIAGAVILRPAGGPAGNGPTPSPSAAADAMNAPAPSLGPSSLPPSTAATASEKARASVTSVTGSSPLDLDATFTSTRHGFSIRYPASWMIVPATTSWSAANGLDAPASSQDTIRGAGAGYAGTVFAGMSTPLPTGVTAHDWITQYYQRTSVLLAQYGYGSCAGDPSSWPTILIGGHVGIADGWAACTPQLNAVVIVGRRAYVFGIGPLYQHPRSRELFQAMLATVVFTPEAAIDTSPLP